MFKMGLHDPFGHFKHKLWPKEKPGVKLPIWLPTQNPKPLKVRNHLDFLAFRWRATYHWKDLDERYNFAQNLLSIVGFHTKLWAPKVVRISFMGISRLPLGGPMTKWHLGAGPVARHKIYCKEEGGGFPQVRVVVSFVSLCLFVAHPCTKMFQLCTNQLVVWFV
jgi:hypothetical protein